MKKSALVIPAIGATTVLLATHHKFLSRIVLGNLPNYAPGAATLNPASPLYGKHIVFLGSSITYGAGAFGKSFVDDLAASDGLIADKLAISGTTLAGPDAKSYISRLQNFHPETTPDAFVCQLSTNDGRAGKRLGTVTKAGTTEFDTETTIGAMEAIITKVRHDWQCPIMFYTCLRRPDDDYEKLIDSLYQLQEKYDFAILDLRHDNALASATSKQPFAMLDDAHPTQLGYLKLWTPIFRTSLSKLLAP